MIIYIFKDKKIKNILKTIIVKKINQLFQYINRIILIDINKLIKFILKIKIMLSDLIIKNTTIQVKKLIILNDALSTIASEFIELIDFAASKVMPNVNIDLHNLTDIKNLPETNASNLNQWQTILGLLITKNGKIRTKLTIREGFPSDQPLQKEQMQDILSWCKGHLGFIELIEDVFNLPNTTNNGQQRALLSALSFLLPRLVAFLDVEFKSHDTCDY